MLQRRTSRRRRGGILLEFALILPLALALITFSVDMGRLVMARTALHDAVSIAARTGARTGNPGTIPSGSTCAPGVAVPADQASLKSFCEALGRTGLVSPSTVTLLAPSAGYCRRDRQEDLFVTVTSTARVDYITPGLSGLLGLFEGGRDIKVTATARCEVAR
jgi:Flp pilus assembly protein TadG